MSVILGLVKERLNFGNRLWHFYLHYCLQNILNKLKSNQPLIWARSICPLESFCNVSNYIGADWIRSLSIAHNTKLQWKVFEVYFKVTTLLHLSKSEKGLPHRAVLVRIVYDKSSWFWLHHGCTLLKRNLSRLMPLSFYIHLLGQALEYLIELDNHRVSIHDNLVISYHLRQSWFPTSR